MSSTSYFPVDTLPVRGLPVCTHDITIGRWTRQIDHLNAKKKLRPTRPFAGKTLLMLLSQTPLHSTNKHFHLARTANSTRLAFTSSRGALIPRPLPHKQCMLYLQSPQATTSSYYIAPSSLCTQACTYTSSNIHDSHYTCP